MVDCSLPSDVSFSFSIFFFGWGRSNRSLCLMTTFVEHGTWRELSRAQFQTVILRSFSVHFGFAQINVLKLIIKSPRFVPFGDNVT